MRKCFKVLQHGRVGDERRCMCMYVCLSVLVPVHAGATVSACAC